MNSSTLWCVRKCSIISQRSLLIHVGIFVAILLTTYVLKTSTSGVVYSFWGVALLAELATVLYLLIVTRLKRSSSAKSRAIFLFRRLFRMTLYILYAAFMPFTVMAIMSFIVASVVEMVDFTVQGFLIRSEEKGLYSKRGIKAFTATLLLACVVSYCGYFSHSVLLSKIGSVILILVMYWDLYLLLPGVFKMTSYYAHHVITAQAAAIALFSSDPNMPPFAALLGAFLLSGAILTRIRRIYRKRMSWDYLGPVIVIINALDYVLAGICIFLFPMFVNKFGGTMTLLLISLFIARVYVNWGFGSGLKEWVINFACRKLVAVTSKKSPNFPMDVIASRDAI
ncbi:MAG: hypothetical protein ISR65_19045 [Bacteriovoracaceae bacterium]|nr:hypothetical protein [Bacteriovoracaceae bacterium]